MTSMPAAAQAELLDRARERGRLAVIVGLAGPDATRSETAMIQVRDRLLRDLDVAAAADGSLAGPGITNVKLFRAIPFLALTVEPDALARLLAHPLVASVQEDAAVPPL